MSTKAEREHAILQLFEALELSKPPKNIDDLLSGEILYKAFCSLLTEETKDILNIPTLSDTNDLPYQDKKRTNFTKLMKCMKQLAEQNSVRMGRTIHLDRIVLNNDEEQLYEMIRQMIRLLTQQKQIISYILKLSNESQTFFMQLLKDQQEELAGSRVDEYLEKIDELEQLLAQKEQVIKTINKRILPIQEENQNLQKELAASRKQSDDLKRKLSEFEELQSVFEKKDAQIKSLNGVVQELKLTMQKDRLKVTERQEQADNELKRLNSILAKYEDNHEVQKWKKIAQQNEKSLTELQAKMKEEKQLMRNLNDRCLKLQSTISQLQNEKMEIVLTVSEKQEKLRILTVKYEEVEQRLKKQLEERENWSRSLRDSNREALGVQLNYQFKAMSQMSVDYCTNVECQKAKQDSKTYLKRNLELTEKLQRLTAAQNGENRPSLLGDEQNRLSALAAQNVRLSQKINSISSNVDAGGFLQENLSKLKKKNVLLKKRIDEEDQRHRQELSIMASVIIELQDILQQNIPNSRIVELLRKLK